MGRQLGASVLASALLLSGCYSTAAPLQDARLTQSSAQNVQAIQQAIAPFFNGMTIQLAHDVFTRSSELVIDSGSALDKRGQVINDRDISSPIGGGSGQRFFLKTDGENCALLHQPSDSLIMLPQVNCAAVNGATPVE
jgi:hypothetical protein